MHLYDPHAPYDAPEAIAARFPRNVSGAYDAEVATADLEVARGVARAPVFPEKLVSPEEVETPGVKTCEALAEFLSIDVAATSKAMPITTDAGSRPPRTR